MLNVIALMECETAEISMPISYLVESHKNVVLAVAYLTLASNWVYLKKALIIIK
jgi:hypothetical protein